MQSSNRVFKQALIDLQLHKDIQKNNALRQLAVTQFVIKGDGGIKQFIKDWFERRMKIKGEHHLGLSKSRIEELKQASDIEIQKAVTERVEYYFPGRSQQIYAAVSQYIAGFFTYALDQGLKCAHTDSQTISIMQPKLEDTDIDLINDPKKPDDILCVCTFKQFEIAFFESPLHGYLEGPLKLVFRMTQVSEDAYGFDFVYYETENKLIDMIYHGELLTDELIVSEVLGPEKSDTSIFDSAYVVPKSNCFRYNNNNYRNQFEFDIYMLSKAIELPGDTIGGEVLRKLLLLIFFSEFFYIKNKAWHLWQDEPDNIPLASLLSHGARSQIHMPAHLAEEFLQWLIGSLEERAKYRRYSATHGIEALPPDQVVTIGRHKKVLYETKKTLVEATMDTFYGFVPNLVKSKLIHFGFDLALGGDGLVHPRSNTIVSSNGEHGHLYIGFNIPEQDTDTPDAAIVFGIEQSSPGANHDPYGGKHTITGAHLNFTATGGDDFAKRPLYVDDDYQGLKGIGPDRYYDCFFGYLDPKLFEHIKMRAPSFSLDKLASVGAKAEIISPVEIEKLQAAELLRKEEHEAGLRKQEEERLRKQAELNEIERLRSKLNDQCIEIIAASDDIRLYIKTLYEKIQFIETENSKLERERDALLQAIAEHNEPKNPIENNNKKQENQEVADQLQQEEVEQDKEQFEKYTTAQHAALTEVFSRLEKAQRDYQQLLLDQKAARQKLELVEKAREMITHRTNQARLELEVIQGEQQQALQRNQAIQDQQVGHDPLENPDAPPPDPQPEIGQGVENHPVVDERSFWQKHWKKILFGAVIGAALVVAGVLTGGLVPIIAAGLGVSFGVATAIGFGGAVVVGSALGAGAGCAAGAMPSREEPGVKAFLSRHKGTIIICGVIAAILIGGALTGGILSAVGIVAGVGFLASVSTGIGAAVASSVGVGAGLATTVTGAAIVTASAATIGTSTGMMIGALIDKNAIGSINSEPRGEQIDREIPQASVAVPAPAKRKLFGCFFTIPSFSLGKIFHRNDPPRPH